MGTTPDTTGDNPYFIRLTLEMGTRKYANAKCDRIRKSEIIDRVCRLYDIDVSFLQTKSQQRRASEARAVAGWLARESGCVILSDIARLVNWDIGSISSSVRRLTDRFPEKPELARRLMSLKVEPEDES